MVQYYKSTNARSIHKIISLIAVLIVIIVLTLIAYQKEKSPTSQTIKKEIIKENFCKPSDPIFFEGEAKRCSNGSTSMHVEEIQSDASAKEIINKYSLKETYNKSQIYFRVGNSNGQSRIIWLNLNKLQIIQIVS
ncbi:MAG: hypothetical protein U0R17_07345 [Acidimicrobiia bacterium]